MALDPESLSGLETGLQNLETLTDRFGKALTGAFATGIVQGRRFEDVLRSLGDRFVAIGLQAGLKPLGTAAEGLLSGGIKAAMAALGGGLGSGLGLGAGGASLPVTPFAQGGVLGAPAWFPLGRGLGLAGEAGPEAILPLARGPDGTLGVRAGAERPAPVVTVQITTPDAESFRRSQAQVAAAVARAVARGQRAL